MDVVRAVCKSGACRFISPTGGAYRPARQHRQTEFRYRGKQYATPLLGAHQARNAAVVLETWSGSGQRVMPFPRRRSGPDWRRSAGPPGLRSSQREPWFVVDGGHNPQCAETVAENIKRYFPGKHVVLLTGVLRTRTTGA
jgi:dihydrofolate synthase/folylpolyglutamate synthase